MGPLQSLHFIIKKKNNIKGIKTNKQTKKRLNSISMSLKDDDSYSKFQTVDAKCVGLATVQNGARRPFCGTEKKFK